MILCGQILMTCRCATGVPADLATNDQLLGRTAFLPNSHRMTDRSRPMVELHA
jgi:hypothetical protein